MFEASMTILVVNKLKFITKAITTIFLIIFTTDESKSILFLWLYIKV